MTKKRAIICSMFSFTVLMALSGCHQKDPDLGPTNPTPPPANIQAGKTGTVLQGGMPAQAPAGGGSK